MKKYILIFVAAVAATVALLLAGCQGGNNAAQQPAPEPETTITDTLPPDTTKGPNEWLRELDLLMR